MKPYNDEEFQEVRQESERLKGIADDSVITRLIATVEDLKGDVKDCFKELQIEQAEVMRLHEENEKLKAELEGLRNE